MRGVCTVVYGHKGGLWFSTQLRIPGSLAQQNKFYEIPLARIFVMKRETQRL